MKKWGLIGHPLTHTFSPDYFKKKFQLLGISDTYEVLDTPSLDHIKAEVSLRGWNGFNVTIPYKESILPLLDEITPLAQSIGAVNAVLVKKDKWIGTNTDVIGFEKSILPFLENQFPRALIIGTGGASKAVHFVLQDKGIETYFLTRNPRLPQHLAYSQIDAESLRHFPLIIQTTPVGTFPDVTAFPLIPYEGIQPSHLLVDLIYNPAETQFLLEGKRRGAKTQNGLRMLEIQADAAWEFWNQPHP